MDPISTFRGKTVAIPDANIDTDQIIPARFLKATEKKGLGKVLFADRPDFLRNKPGAQGASVIVAGDNFGSGSSREHAPWALVDCGFRAVISTSFADIFQNNSLKNGLLTIIVDPETHREALAAGEKNAEVAVDLPNQRLTLPSGKSVTFPIDGFAKSCLVKGVDELGYLLSHADRIAAFEARRV